MKVEFDLMFELMIFMTNPSKVGSLLVRFGCVYLTFAVGFLYFGKKSKNAVRREKKTSFLDWFVGHVV